MRKAFTPREYQTLAIEHIISTPRCAVWAGMGMGKTVSTLTAMAGLKSRGERRRTLLLAPLRVARTTWPEEAMKWEHLADLRVAHCCGDTPAKRTKLLNAALAADADVICINYESLPWLIEQFGAGKRPWPFDCYVADESRKLSGFRPRQGTKRAKLLYQMSRHADARFIQLTGTPAPKGLMDLFGQLYFLDDGARLGRTFTAWTQSYFNEFALDYNVTLYTPKKGALVQVMQRVKDLCLTLKPEDYFDLRAPQSTTVAVDLPADARQFYDELERELIAEIAGLGVRAMNSAVLSGKLLQVTSGAVYVASGSHEFQELHTAKLDALDSLVEELGGEPLIVVYKWKSDLARLRQRFPKARELRTPQDEADWNAGKIDMLLLHPASAGHGLNLQHGGRNMCWFSVDFDLELYQQVRERIGPVRQLQSGYDRIVREYYLLARDTIDELAMQRLEGKALTQDELMAYAKRRAVQ